MKWLIFRLKERDGGREKTVKDYKIKNKKKNILSEWVRVIVLKTLKTEWWVYIYIYIYIFIIVNTKIEWIVREKENDIVETRIRLDGDNTTTDHQTHHHKLYLFF